MPVRKTVVLIALSMASFGVTVTRAIAWGEDGHVMLARIAELNLTTETKQSLANLLPDTLFSNSSSISASHLATYADFVKHNSQFPAYTDSGPWHFVDIPVDPPSEYDPDQVCKDGQCVLEQIDRFKAVLADKNLDKVKRQEALVFLVHLVGDLHQPLHCATRNDIGGNKLSVKYLGHTGHHLNLHTVWDVNLVQENMKSFDPLKTAADFNNAITDDQRKEWGKGATKDWMMESYNLARTKVYVLKGDKIPTHGEPDLDDEYVKSNKDVVAEQIKKGGVRLAKILNDALTAH